MKKIWIVLFALLNSLVANAQTDPLAELKIDAELEMKYWQYRYRFLGDDNDRDKYPGFISVGNGPGQSLPIDSRNKYISNQGWFLSHDNHSNPILYNPNDPESQLLFGGFRMSDSPSDLGNYLAVLATEWKLTKNNNLPTDKTELEIYYALRTINRLDSIQETIYGYPTTINGFIARNDARSSFQYKNYDITGASGFRFGKNYPFYMFNDEPVNAQVSANIDPWIGLFGPGYYNNNELNIDHIANTMSQDQAIGLLFGLVFVVKLIDNNISIGGINLVSESQNIIHRIILFIKDSPYSENYYADWTIVGPNHKRVARGGYAQTFSYPLARIGNMYTTYNNHDNAFSETIGLYIWNYIESESHNNPELPFEIMIPVNPLWSIPSPISISVNDYNYSMILKLASLTNTWNHTTLAKTSYNLQREVYELAGAVLHNYSPKAGPLNIPYPLFSASNHIFFEPCQIDLAKYRWALFLNSSHCDGFCFDDHSVHTVTPCQFCNITECAPQIQGTPCSEIDYSQGDYSNSSCPYSGNFDNSIYNSWNVIDRFSDALLVDADDCYSCDYNTGVLSDYKNASGLYGEYNGLDWMLAYNLYRLAFDPSGTYMGLNGINRNIEYQLPINASGFGANSSNYTIGNHSSPTTYYSPSSFTLTSTHSSQASATYIAPNEITLTDGFSASLNADVTVKIGAFQCEPNLHEYSNGVILNYRLSDSTSYANADFDQIMIYPNPTDNEFSIHSLNYNNYQYFIYSIQGYLIEKGTLINHAQIVSKYWPKGVYIVSFKNIETNEINHKKIIIQ